MSDEKIEKLKDSIKDLINDMLTNEVAIVEKTDNSQKVLAYARVELGGDAIQVINQESKEIARLQNALLVTAMQNRKILWNFISEVLS